MASCPWFNFLRGSNKISFGAAHSGAIGIEWKSSSCHCQHHTVRTVRESFLFHFPLQLVFLFVAQLAPIHVQEPCGQAPK